MVAISKSDLLEHIRDEWNALTHATAPLAEQQMTECSAGEWSIKDHLAHIAAWEKFLLASQFQGQSPEAALGFAPAVLERNDENEMNTIFWERNRGRTVADVLAESKEVHAALLTALEQAAEREMQTPTCMVGPRVEPRTNWVIWNTYEHYAEHRRTIEAKIQAQ